MKYYELPRNMRSSRAVILLLFLRIASEVASFGAFYNVDIATKEIKMKPVIQDRPDNKQAEPLH